LYLKFDKQCSITLIKAYYVNLQTEVKKKVLLDTEYLSFRWSGGYEYEWRGNNGIGNNGIINRFPSNLKLDDHSNDINENSNNINNNNDNTVDPSFIRPFNEKEQVKNK
jgi:hypothetical protein